MARAWLLGAPRLRSSSLGLGWKLTPASPLPVMSMYRAHPTRDATINPNNEKQLEQIDGKFGRRSQREGTSYVEGLADGHEDDGDDAQREHVFRRAFQNDPVLAARLTLVLDHGIEAGEEEPECGQYARGHEQTGFRPPFFGAARSVMDGHRIAEKRKRSCGEQHRQRGKHEQHGDAGSRDGAGWWQFVFHGAPICLGV